MTYQTTETFRHGNCTVVIHRPILTKEERSRIERQVLTVLEATMKSYIARKESKA